MLVIGVTGSLGTGKSTVATMLAEQGAKVLDADLIARRQLHRGKEGFQKIVKVFGSEILTQGRVDRKKLAEIVFNDEKCLRKLEGIIHPAVRKEILQKLEKYKKGRQQVVVLDVPLLFESGLDAYVDLKIVVKATRDIQIQRAIQQLKITKVQAIKRIKAQMPLRAKMRLADIIIDNSGNLNQTRKEVKNMKKIYF